MKKIVYVASLLLIISNSQVQGNWIADNMIDAGADAGYYETQTRGLYSLGSQTIKFREIGGTINPIHVEPPRFNVGCGAIDIAMGGFSYLNPEFIIEKLKAISAAAPAFVYQMAISALCKDCQNIMNELEKFANMANGMNFDTCDAVQAAQGAGKAVGEAMNNTIFSGQSDSWLSQRLESATNAMQGWKNNLQNHFGGDATKANEMMEILVLKGSLLHISATKGLPDVSKLDLLGNDANNDKLILSLFRAAVGDVIGGEQADGTPVDYALPGEKKEEFFKKLYEGGKIPYISYNPSTKEISKLGEHDFTQGTKEIIRDHLIQIYNKMKIKQTLSDEDKKFLSTLTFPVYKYLNTAVLSKADSDFDLMASQIAAGQTKDLVLYLSGLIARGVSSYIALNGKDISNHNIESARLIVANINDLSKQTVQYHRSIQENFVNSKSVKDYIEQRDQQLKTQSAYQAFMTAGQGR
ncbi:conjugal transfer protein TraH [Sulfurimonas sp.]|uniref:conjugal transfer protein TraH n=1 Tax=Sulfurimonas sp. TaxID=2022749 RepID=UPI0025E019EF|nr:conjugal transfer protein TraH [Sulfurimonas sp.]MCK9473678.1 conjugal transfer protein TraH [Sulfurimonas sp.]